MCVAIVKPKNAVITDDTLRNCFDNNPDGAGYAYLDNGRIILRKGFFDIESFLEAYHADAVNDRQALVHFRITTRGDDSADNCHPFPLAQGALVHNGTIHGLGKRGEGKSDTAMFAEMIHGIDAAHLEAMRPMIEDYVRGSRIAVLTAEGQFIVYHANEWLEHNGALYSNDGYLSDSTYASWRHTPTTKEGLAFNHRYGDLEDDDPLVQAWDRTARRWGGVQRDDFYYGNSYIDYGFLWENGELWREVNGKLARDRDTEDAVYDIWFSDDNVEWPEDDDQPAIDAITIEIISNEEIETWNSSSNSPRLSTATPTTSSPLPSTTSTPNSPSPSSSTTRLLA